MRPKFANNEETLKKHRIDLLSGHNRTMNSIRLKLALALVMTTAVTVAGMSIFIHWSFGKGFTDYVNARELEELQALQQALAESYTEEGSWDFLRENRRRWGSLLQENLDPSLFRAPAHPRDREGRPPPPKAGERRQAGPPPPRRHEHSRPPPPGSRPPEPEQQDRFARRLVLFDQNNRRIIGNPAVSLTSSSKETSDKLGVLDIEAGNILLGRLVITQSQVLKERQDLGFVAQQNQSLMLISALVLLLALLVSLPLAGHFVRPVKALLLATRALTAGHFGTRTTVSSRDELGQLTEHFNSLAETLEANESSRKRWIADISHELRTPLAVLKGQIEAVIDGIRNPDSAVLGSLNNQVCHLSKLVDDLYQLSLADMGALNYRKENLALDTLLKSCIEDYEHAFQEKGIRLTVDVNTSQDGTLFADADRLTQLFNNLLTNTLRYTDAPGELQIALRGQAGHFELSFSDSAPGVSEPDLKRLFERLYRVDKSRNRASGGAGLGLSLCENIVKAHHGKIVATASPLGGVCIHINLKSQADNQPENGA